MKVLNGWIGTSLMALFAAMIGYLAAESGTGWHSFNFPLPIMKQGYDRFRHIYLADFAYLGFLVVTAYWVLLARVGKVSPTRQNLVGLLLGLAIAAFIISSADFLLGFLPLSSHCQMKSYGTDVVVTFCRYDPSPRYWLASAGAFALLGSLVASAKVWTKSTTASAGVFE